MTCINIRLLHIWPHNLNTGILDDLNVVNSWGSRWVNMSSRYLWVSFVQLNEMLALSHSQFHKLHKNITKAVLKFPSPSWWCQICVMFYSNLDLWSPSDNDMLQGDSEPHGLSNRNWSQPKDDSHCLNVPSLFSIKWIYLSLSMSLYVSYRCLQKVSFKIVL